MQEFGCYEPDYDAMTFGGKGFDCTLADGRTASISHLHLPC